MKPLFLIRVDGWLADLDICLQRIQKFVETPHEILLLDVMENSGLKSKENISVTNLPVGFGWGQTFAHAFENNSHSIQILMDMSTLLTGDPLPQVIAELEDPQVIGAGWHGGLFNLEEKWRSVDDKGPGEVDVLFSYFFAIKREKLLESEGFEPEAHFYRNADIELSCALRATGGRLLSLDLPMEQGRHHGYHDSEENYRNEESKRNYVRMLKKYRGRDEILAPRR